MSIIPDFIAKLFEILYSFYAVITKTIVKELKRLNSENVHVSLNELDLPLFRLKSEIYCDGLL